MHPLETYLTELCDIRSTGAAVKETSYYPALANLLNEVGKALKPKVRCVLTLKNRGAGILDGGLCIPGDMEKNDYRRLRCLLGRTPQVDGGKDEAIFRHLVITDVSDSTDSTMSGAFIFYSRKDKEFVHQLHEALAN